MPVPAELARRYVAQPVQVWISQWFVSKRDLVCGSYEGTLDMLTERAIHVRCDPCTACDVDHLWIPLSQVERLVCALDPDAAPAPRRADPITLPVALTALVALDAPLTVERGTLGFTRHAERVPDVIKAALRLHRAELVWLLEQSPARVVYRERPAARRTLAAPETPDPWTVLGVRPGADPETLRAAYMERIRQLHPDRNPAAADPELGRLLTARAAAVNHAYDVLSGRTVAAKGRRTA